MMCDARFIVQNTISMCSVLILGGLGAGPPEKKFKIIALRLNFRGIFVMKMNEEEPALFVNEELVLCMQP